MHGFWKNLRSKVLLTRFVLLLFHVAWTFYHHVCNIRQFVLPDFFFEFLFHSSLLCSMDGSQIPHPKFHKIFHFIWWNFFLQRLKILNCSLVLKVTLFFSSTILKYWRDLFSLQILKNAPTYDNVLGGWYIYRQPAIVVSRVGLYRQPLLKFSRSGNYR